MMMMMVTACACGHRKRWWWWRWWWWWWWCCWCWWWWCRLCLWSLGSLVNCPLARLPSFLGDRWPALIIMHIWWWWQSLMMIIMVIIVILILVLWGGHLSMIVGLFHHDEYQEIMTIMTMTDYDWVLIRSTKLKVSTSYCFWVSTFLEGPTHSLLGVCMKKKDERRKISCGLHFQKMKTKDIYLLLGVCIKQEDWSLRRVLPCDKASVYNAKTKLNNVIV